MLDQVFKYNSDNPTPGSPPPPASAAARAVSPLPILTQTRCRSVTPGLPRVLTQTQTPRSNRSVTPGFQFPHPSFANQASGAPSSVDSRASVETEFTATQSAASDEEFVAVVATRYHSPPAGDDHLLRIMPSCDIPVTANISALNLHVINYMDCHGYDDNALPILASFMRYSKATGKASDFKDRCVAAGMERGAVSHVWYLSNLRA